MLSRSSDNRLGTLLMFLGLGVAVATGHSAVASADTGDSGESPSSANSTRSVTGRAHTATSPGVSAADVSRPHSQRGTKSSDAAKEVGHHGDAAGSATSAPRSGLPAVQSSLRNQVQLNLTSGGRSSRHAASAIAAADPPIDETAAHESTGSETALPTAAASAADDVAVSNPGPVPPVVRRSTAAAAVTAPVADSWLRAFGLLPGGPAAPSEPSSSVAAAGYALSRRQTTAVTAAASEPVATSEPVDSPAAIAAAVTTDAEIETKSATTALAQSGQSLDAMIRAAVFTAVQDTLNAALSFVHTVTGWQVPTVHVTEAGIYATRTVYIYNGSSLPVQYAGISFADGTVANAPAVNTVIEPYKTVPIEVVWAVDQEHQWIANFYQVAVGADGKTAGFTGVYYQVAINVTSSGAFNSLEFGCVTGTCDIDESAQKVKLRDRPAQSASVTPDSAASADVTEQRGGSQSPVAPVTESKDPLIHAVQNALNAVISAVGAVIGQELPRITITPVGVYATQRLRFTNMTTSTIYYKGRAEGSSEGTIADELEYDHPIAPGESVYFDFTWVAFKTRTYILNFADYKGSQPAGPVQNYQASVYVSSSGAWGQKCAGDNCAAYKKTLYFLDTPGTVTVTDPVEQAKLYEAWCGSGGVGSTYSSCGTNVLGPGTLRFSDYKQVGASVTNNSNAVVSTSLTGTWTTTQTSSWEVGTSVDIPQFLGIVKVVVSGKYGQQLSEAEAYSQTITVNVLPHNTAYLTTSSPYEDFPAEVLIFVGNTVYVLENATATFPSELANPNVKVCQSEGGANATCRSAADWNSQTAGATVAVQPVDEAARATEV